MDNPLGGIESMKYSTVAQPRMYTYVRIDDFVKMCIDARAAVRAVIG